MRLKDLVQIDSRFEKSVNLLLDLNQQGQKKINAYIPTHSSVNLLKRYLGEIKEFTGAGATLLFGPYGKGKSHLLLVLLKLISGEKSKELDRLVQRIASVDEEAGKLIDEISSSHKFLPVIIDTHSGNLNQAFIYSLNQSLKTYGFEDIVPSTLFNEALLKIDLWQENFPETFASFSNLLKPDKMKAFKERLQANDDEALAKFRKLYPKVTAGSVFNPSIDDNALKVYQSINETLKSRNGYSGIYIIFDEFSKYIEGHLEEGFSADMKVLQDFCELCNESRDPGMFLTCVVHKTIRSYGNSLSKLVLNAFKGIEGRLTEIQFNVSYQNNYELISDAISKKKADFKIWAKDSGEFQSIVAKSYEIPEFSSQFEKKDFERIVGEGCFPLSPLAACLLVDLSEKIAQNERTLFTFLSGKDIHGLSSFVEHCEDVRLAGADLIYDYFLPLFEAEKTTTICHEWMKANFCLSKTTDEIEQKVIKSLAVINMANHPDDLPASKEFLALALGLPSDLFDSALESLCKKNLIVYKEKNGCYDFRTRIGIDVEAEISDCVTKFFASVNLPEVLNEVRRRRYILPKKYNQTYAMTRYFKILYMNVDSFLKFSSSDYLSDDNKPDGYFIVVCKDSQGKADKNALIKHVEEIGEAQSVFAFPSIKNISRLRKAAQRLCAVQRLTGQESFVSENEVLLPEFRIMEAELVDEMNEWMAETEASIKTVYFKKQAIKISSFGLNRAVSDICEAIYNQTPIINHEMVNRHVVSSQIAKARNTLMEDILCGRSMDAYNAGTSAEATIYRALLSNTKNDASLTAIKAEISSFIRSACDKKVPFEPLVKRLLSPPYGLRRGPLPVFLMKQLVELEDMPVVYYENQEFSIDVPVMSNISLHPEGYYLYIEPNTAQKIQYIEGLSKLFEYYGAFCKEIEERNRLAKLICTIQSWYRSLPQASVTFRVKDHDKQDVEKIDAFRKLFIGNVNPREIVFDALPALFGNKGFPETLSEIERLKGELDRHVSLLKKSVVCVVRKQLCLKKNANLLLSIKEWCSGLPEKAKVSILSLNSQRLLECLKSLETSDYEEVAQILSKEVTGLYVEDWSDNTINDFEQGLIALLEEIKERKNVPSDNLQKVVFSTENGDREWQYIFDEKDASGPAHFFEEQVASAIDEFGASIENNEKIGALMKIVKQIIGGKP